MYFLVSKTFEVVTEESAEQGDIADHGFVYEDEVLTLKELIYELRSCSYLSSSVVDRFTWASTEPELNYRSGESRQTSIHIHLANGKPPTAWQLKRLYKVAGLTA